MENNLNNKSAQESQNRSNSTSNTSSNSSSQRSMSSDNTASTGSTNSQSAQGRSNQQATSGKDSMKNIQDTLQQYSNPIAKKISSLTTTQKVVGGSLLALGAGWLALGSSNKNKLKEKASHLTANAKQKMNAKKSDKSSASNMTSRSGSSTTDARVK